MLSVKIISPERVLFDGQVLSACLPGSVFPFEVLNDHAPIISTLEKGDIVLKKQDGSSESIAIRSGVARVDNNLITVCVEI